MKLSISDSVRKAFDRFKAKDSSYQRTVLLRLQTSGQHVYAGTVSPQVKARRRARSKMARRSRAVNRRVAKR